MILIVHGYEGSGVGHWQHWLAGELERLRVPVAFPALPDPSAPLRDAWVAALAALVRTTDAPLTFVCHSLGCWAVDHLLATHPVPTAHAALLVAPPSPYLLFEPVESFFPPPRRRETWAPLAPYTLVLGSDDDDYTGPEEFAEIADTLGARCQILPGAGHVNVAAGFGPWPFALEWLASVGAL